MANKNQFGKKGWTPERLGSLAGKTCVITGANATLKQEFGSDADVTFVSEEQGGRPQVR
jgi:hypothetical protein